MPRPAGFADSSTTPTRPFAPSSSPARTGPGCTRSSTCIVAGWRRSFAATGRSGAPRQTRRYLTARLRPHPYEVFACLFLDNRHRVIAFEELFRGTVDGTSVHPREVVRCALRHNAAAVILAHNHPSGDPDPSHADRLLTDQLVSALAMVEVRVLDHLVIGDGECVSFSERGLV